jgi:predicted anti-sigma-YlaC factor YlaD
MESQAIHTQPTSQVYRKDDDAVWAYETPRAGRAPARWVRWTKRAMSISLLAVASVMGVHLGTGAPDVSPVSPAAIAARVGTPPTDAGVPLAVPAGVTQAVPVRHGGGHHRGAGHE